MRPFPSLGDVARLGVSCDAGWAGAGELVIAASKQLSDEGDKRVKESRAEMIMEKEDRHK